MAGGIKPSISIVANWPTPNYDDPERLTGLLPSVIIFAILATAMVTARLVVRGFIQKNMGLDDWIIIVAMFPTIGLVIVTCYAGTAAPFGVHLWDVLPTEWVTLRKIQFAVEMLYVIASSLVKISILFFFRRLSAATLTRTYVAICWAGIIFCSSYMVSFIFVFFNCKPVSAYWSQYTYLHWATHQDFNNPDSWTCQGEPIITMVSGAVSLTLDIICALLPLWLFGVLKIPIREKIALGFVFVIGFVSCAIGATRIWLTHRLFYGSFDATYTGYPLLTLTAIEPLLGIVCASAPALKILFRRAVDRYHSTIRDGDSTHKVTGNLSQNGTVTSSAPRHGRGSSVGRTSRRSHPNADTEELRAYDVERERAYNHSNGKNWTTMAWTEKPSEYYTR